MLERYKNRKSNIELLRIISMLMVVSCHNTSQFINFASPTRGGVLSESLTAWFGGLGVMLFFIISAWFLVEKSFSISRVFNVLIENIIFVIVNDAISFILLFSVDGLSIIALLKSFVLFIIEKYLNFNFNWYVIAYCCVLMTTPFLNNLLYKYCSHTIKKFLLLFSFVPIMTNFISVNQIFGGTVYFIYIYILIGYLKIYKSDNFIKKHSVIISVIVIIIYLILRLFIAITSNSSSGIFGIVSMVLDKTIASDRGFSFIILIMAISVYYSFLKFNIQNNRLINFLGHNTFSVYLSHGIFFLQGPIFYRFVSDNNVMKEFWNIFINPFLMNYSLGTLLSISVFIIILYFASGFVGFIIESAFFTPFANLIITRNMDLILKIDKFFNNKI